jgi:hypothetical protein
MTCTKSLRLLAPLALIVFQLACAQFMAVRQPGPVDRAILQPDVERSTLVGVLGAPSATSEGVEGETVRDTYHYTDGGNVNRFGGKAARILLYTAGDVFTLFLTQLIWMPAELVLDGTDYSATVDYQRRPRDQQWVAAHIVETKQEGKRRSTVRSKLASVAAAPPAGVDPKLTATTPTDSHGTCFAVSPDGLIVTAHHLVTPAGDMEVRLSDGRQLPASVARQSSASGLALLELQTDTPEHLPLSTAPPQLGERVFTIGYAGAKTFDSSPTFSEGSVANLSGPGGDATFLQITVPVEPGSSGSPLVTEDGRAVGVITSAIAVEDAIAGDDSLPEDTNWAVNGAYGVLLVGSGQSNVPISTRSGAINRVRGALCQVHVTRGRGEGEPASADAAAAPDESPPEVAIGDAEREVAPPVERASDSD